MPATLAPSFAPANALRMWSDGRTIFVELPTQAHLAPVILSFKHSESGLSRALSLLAQHADYSGAPVIVSRKTPMHGTAVQHDVAANILRRMGVVR